VEYGTPIATIAEYNPHTLRLGARCTTYASATARGSMYVYGEATSTGYVSGIIYWYQKGLLAGYLLPPGVFECWITVKFQAIDLTTGPMVEKVVFHKDAAWEDYGTWHWDVMDIPLYQGHEYKFVLYVEVHAEVTGAGSAVADFGGMWLADRLIQWGYIEVPNTTVPGDAHLCIHGVEQNM